ncbi:hypothetical protein ACJX0J_000615 [Zea mays]
MNLRYVEIFFSIYRDRDIENKYVSIVESDTTMGQKGQRAIRTAAIHFSRAQNQASFGKTFEYPMEMGFINNFILKKGLGERLVMVLYALFYRFGFMGTDLWMKIQKS